MSDRLDDSDGAIVPDLFYEYIPLIDYTPNIVHLLYVFQVRWTLLISSSRMMITRLILRMMKWFASLARFPIGFFLNFVNCTRFVFFKFFPSIDVSLFKIHSVFSDDELGTIISSYLEEIFISSVTMLLEILSILYDHLLFVKNYHRMEIKKC